ncbi:TonB family protein [Mucilaginibacter terrae]|uniref:energy transducer TonB n=1 Tax=Mucilaginibacter terrae TaxID=1955052 RepID=UPI0036450924
MKTLIIALLSFLLPVIAQKKSVIFYKKDGSQASSRKDAEYSRVVKEPETATDFYTVQEYYMDGKLKGEGKAISLSPYKYEGPYTNYYPNGNKKSVLNYNSNVLKGKQSYYYVNGKLNEVRVYPDSSAQSNTTPNRQYFIETYNDTTGTPLITGGNGYYKNTTGGKIKTINEGPVKQGLKDGEWTITVGKDSILVKEVYAKGIFVRGNSKFANGETYSYDKPDRKAEFAEGTKVFYQLLGKALRYPSVAVENRKQGRVYISFNIQKDGTLSDFKLVGTAPDESLVTEAIRVISISSPWLPAMQYGRAVSAKYTIPVVFILDR